jgi:hypothetical protein
MWIYFYFDKDSKSLSNHEEGNSFMEVPILRLQPRLCAANPFKVDTVKELHKLHLKPCF